MVVPANWIAERRAGRIRTWLDSRGLRIEQEHEDPAVFVARLSADPGPLASLRQAPDIAFVEAAILEETESAGAPRRFDFVGIVPPPRGAWNQGAMTRAILSYVDPHGSVRTVRLSIH